MQAYDVVIIGGSVTGRDAAMTATKLGAKVALVEPANSEGVRGDLYFSLLAPQTLTRLGQVTSWLSAASQYGIATATADNNAVIWTEAKQWAENVCSNLAEQNSPAVLAALGVDFILGNGQFERRSQLSFVVN